MIAEPQMRARLRTPLFSSLLLAVVCAALCAASASAQSDAHATASAQHLTVSLLVPPRQLYPGQTFTAGLDFRLEPHWHVYWTNAGDSGEPPTIDWKLPPSITAGPMQFPAPARLPLGPLMDFGYENEVVFPIPIQVASDFHSARNPAVLSAHVGWLVCSAVCIPGKADLSLTRPALNAAPAAPSIDADAQSLIARFQNKLPQPLPAADSATFSTTPQGFVLDLRTNSSPSSAQFFPLDSTVVANAAPQPAHPLRNGIQLALTKDENIQGKPHQLNGVLELPSGAAYLIHATLTTAAGAPSLSLPLRQGGLAASALLAFLGGILLNLMPCVFPVLFIKGLALVQSSQQERHRLRAHGWVYTLGILISFWIVVAVLLILRAAGRQLGWGFQFQSPIFLALMAMLLFFLGLALAGQFEIGLSLTSAGGSLAQKHGYAGSFFTGVLAVIVATPCTAPFMGAAIGYALSHSPLVSFTVFTALALGLAIPYLLLAYFPGWARLLPKPGAWMEILKQAVAVPIFATVIWLVWVFTQVAGAAALMGLLAAFLLLAIAGWFFGRWPGRAIPRLAAAFVLIAAIVTSVWTVNTLGEPSPAQTASLVSDVTQGKIAPSAWQPFTPAALADARTHGHAVFVDFTASWCLSCQVNERLILDRADVERKLHDSGVTLLRADWTNQDPDITRALAALGRSGVPTYAIYPADPSAPPQVLPTVLTPGIVLDALKSLPQQNTASNPPSSTP
ncbi:MAG TPA: protein-disulfide reductase DsbD domain-containing protein [Acidobacteriaceae bacterium]|nr:protein-disulfide reductase DsbD domain-containing protein [Acidobacteriaceae bacterium]